MGDGLGQQQHPCTEAESSGPGLADIERQVQKQPASAGQRKTTQRVWLTAVGIRKPARQSLVVQVSPD